MTTLLVLLMSLVVLAATTVSSPEGQSLVAFFGIVTVLLLGVMLWTGVRAWRTSRRRSGGDSGE